MTQALMQWFIDNLGGKAANEVIVFLISMMPILELRGGLLAAGPAVLNVDMWRAVPLSVIGNLLPVPFILWFITPIFTWMKGTNTFKPIVSKLEVKAMSKSDKIEKYEFWGLLLFVGIPLPGTGAWTGALIATLLGVRFKKAFPAIALGVLVACLIMTILSYTILGNLFG